MNAREYNVLPIAHERELTIVMILKTSTILHELLTLFWSS